MRLDGGQMVGKVAMDLQGPTGAGIDRQQSLQLGLPHSHGREFGRDKEGAHQDEDGAEDRREQAHGAQPRTRSEPRRSWSWMSFSSPSRF